MSYRLTREYIRSLSIGDLESISRAKTYAVLKRFVHIRLSLDKKAIDTKLWVYIGVERDHIVVPETYCSCKHFIIRVMSEKETPVCIHLLAQRLALEKKMYRVVEVDIDSYVSIVREIIEYGRSRILRKKLYSRSERPWVEGGRSIRE